MTRVRMLIEIKKNEEQGISKRELADLIGVNHNNIQKWRGLYLAGGIELLCSHKKTGFRPSIISKEMHVVISSLLNDPQNGLRGYNELMIYLEKEFNKKINHYGLKIHSFNKKVKNEIF